MWTLWPPRPRLFFGRPARRFLIFAGRSALAAVQPYVLDPAGKSSFGLAAAMFSEDPAVRSRAGLVIVMFFAACLALFGLFGRPCAAFCRGESSLPPAGIFFGRVPPAVVAKAASVPGPVATPVHRYG